MGVRVGVALLLCALEWAWQTFLNQSIGIDEANTFNQSIGIVETNTFRSGRGKFIFGSIELGVANFFLGQSIGLAETNTFQLKFFIRGKLFFGSIDRY